ncbi:hypothetical protein IMG5_027200 [Ichthyophthirius multifiliis]|uniref:Uncharacterized protein n=1 Tax=Ichthyophthirius multifiliis TaxID=5932 RepID=G0QL93_ICHMU|nr:hypothetical protein IMG5_027200 [Ichthyophthirius multifiliis]EGR34022.1 hypothetical protein IMG5_027200 [Ichthyophthirius multifiliis]|eukprot:XP_004039326.1 hypothetical protein IMG5_027200 [Ichthyophthirius multifiliis]
MKICINYGMFYQEKKMQQYQTINIIKKYTIKQVVKVEWVKYVNQWPDYQQQQMKEIKLEKNIDNIQKMNMFQYKGNITKKQQKKNKKNKSIYLIFHKQTKNYQFKSIKI